jgi:hypothetical protein
MVLCGGCLQILGYQEPTVVDPGTGGGATTSSASSTATGAGVCAPGATTPCYDGPAKTEGMGSCVAGKMTCNDEGSAYGPCADEVTPTLENCAAPADENCDGLAPSCKGDFSWAKRFGDMDDQVATSVGVDSMGNVVVAGYFVSSLEFGSGPLNSAGSADVFLAKLDANGFLLWGYGFGDMSAQSAASIALDTADGVVVAGSFAGSLDFGGGAITSGGNADVFVAKLDASGKNIWSKRFGSTDDASIVKVAVDDAKNVFVLGNFSGSVTFGDKPLNGAGNGDFFLAKLDANGSPLWSKRFGDAANQSSCSGGRRHERAVHEIRALLNRTPGN